MIGYDVVFRRDGSIEEYEHPTRDLAIARVASLMIRHSVSRVEEVLVDINDHQRRCVFTLTEKGFEKN